MRKALSGARARLAGRRHAEVRSTGVRERSRVRKGYGWAEKAREVEGWVGRFSLFKRRAVWPASLDSCSSSFLSGLSNDVALILPNDHADLLGCPDEFQSKDQSFRQQMDSSMFGLGQAFLRQRITGTRVDDAPA